jgi:hypothetical protein
MIRLFRRIVPVLLLGSGGCAGGLTPLPMPTGLAPGAAAAAEQWAATTRPAENREIRFRWKFQDEQGAAGGRGRARLALPDSLRFDVVGPLGSGRAAAFVSGDTALWADPEGDVKKLVPNYPLFWAMLGVVRGPPPGALVRTFADGTITAWQFAAGGDTVEYVRETGSPSRLLAEVRQAGKRLGRVETKFGPDGVPLTSRLLVQRPAARLDLTFYQNEKARPFAPDTWLRPAPAER